MAAKMLLSPNPHTLCSLPFDAKLHPCLGMGMGMGMRWHQRSPPRRTKRLHVSLHDHQQLNPYSLVLLAEGVGYSTASYYTSLGLFVISVPGLWSLIKRSVKSKIVKKTFISEGEKKPPNRVAAEILAFFTRNNFAVTDRGETITLASVALVLTITFPDVGNNWFWITILSPLAGAYYWTRASRKEQIKVKMILEDEGALSEIIVQGDDQQVEQMRKELKFSEKGMVYVKGVFER
ncbi:protein COFACTOR ASSEMBLY OF COMPLEX C SUBUNIT B CCB1, chloroplastic isoform X2 [Abrus precatorius]|uniref:Protein COFACTOR ASSEMBLY OF COMPLEX C SUBUNIT B CCB1, chloroplastic isoform X2 n=1 Tax=Abrus precatorius TaxID=3816 RepID=A0A8B8L201_ABRPR|nr:protein COFACTOR ASSEMBLY OF COMPLEX C SUBUNIT B CCB1, chloroplastic isoform X2 [Abrus precatorius]